AMFLTLLAGWLITPTTPWLWPGFIFAVIAVPPLLPFFLGMKPRLRGISKRSHYRGKLSDLGIGAAQVGLTITFLAYQAWVMSDAILRTLVRLFITRRKF